MVGRDRSVAPGWTPLLLRLEAARCVVVGGGRVAERKIGALLEAGARVEVFAKRASAELQRMAETGRILLSLREPVREDLRSATLVVVATDDRELNERVSQWAQEIGVPCNVVDKPELCTAIFPAILRRGRLQLAVSTGGASPAMAALIRDRLSDVFGPEYQWAVELLFELRSRIQSMNLEDSRRLRVLRSLASDELVRACRDADQRAVERFVSDCLAQEISLRQLGIDMACFGMASSASGGEGGGGN